MFVVTGLWYAVTWLTPWLSGCLVLRLSSCWVNFQIRQNTWMDGWMGLSGTLETSHLFVCNWQLAIGFVILCQLTLREVVLLFVDKGTTLITLKGTCVRLLENRRYCFSDNRSGQLFSVCIQWILSTASFVLSYQQVMSIVIQNAVEERPLLPLLM